MSSCRKCLLAGHDITAGAIFSGNSGAKLMIIGQAPGVTEVEAGRPFNAGSGTRLFEWLAEAGIDESEFRSRQYMTSVTKCFPGKASSGGGDRVPSSEEQELCRPYLESEIELVDPKIVIPVGRLAINSYFPKSRPLTQIIGTEKRENDRWLIPLPHPSGASRWHQSESNRALIQQAIGKIKKRRNELVA
ncbi:MAG: uracil-DNA glycosylase family protein [Anaerolineales bacterium]